MLYGSVFSIETGDLLHKSTIVHHLMGQVCSSIRSLVLGCCFWRVIYRTTLPSTLALDRVDDYTLTVLAPNQTKLRQAQKYLQPQQLCEAFQKLAKPAERHKGDWKAVSYAEDERHRLEAPLSTVASRYKTCCENEQGSHGTSNELRYNMIFDRMPEGYLTELPRTLILILFWLSSWSPAEGSASLVIHKHTHPRFKSDIIARYLYHPNCVIAIYHNLFTSKSCRQRPIR